MQHTKTAKRATAEAQHHTTQFFDVQAKLVTVDEAEKLTGISAWTWRSWVYSGKIASVKVGVSDKSKNRRLLIPVAEIRRVLAEGYRPRVAAAAKG